LAFLPVLLRSCFCRTARPPCPFGLCKAWLRDRSSQRLSSVRSQRIIFTKFIEDASHLAATGRKLISSSFCLKRMLHFAFSYGTYRYTHRSS
jgi:hypothetical protein